MDRPIIFLDCDGCLASQGKMWHEEEVGPSSWPGFSTDEPKPKKVLSVTKTISDHDSWAIDHFKQHADIIIISGDERINRAWAERRGVSFIFTAEGGFHQNKWKYLTDFWYENLAMGSDDKPHGKYYYLGDAMPDWTCMANAKRAYFPRDSSAFIYNKIKAAIIEDKNAHKNFEILDTNSGHGCFDEMAWLLVQDGVLPDVK